MFAFYSNFLELSFPLFTHHITRLARPFSLARDSGLLIKRKPEHIKHAAPQMLGANTNSAEVLIADRSRESEDFLSASTLEVSIRMPQFRTRKREITRTRWAFSADL